MAQFPHSCGWPRVQCVPAHSNQQKHGRGKDLKSDDQFHAAVCPEAHDLIDGRKGGWTKEEKAAEWDRAYIATQRYYWQNGKVQVAP